MIQPQPRPVAQFAVYSKTDGVADWSSCIEEDSRHNTEVKCTHIGMVFHPDVYRVIARRLAQRVHPGGHSAGLAAHAKEEK
jgi:hypothetical protein